MKSTTRKVLIGVGVAVTVILILLLITFIVVYVHLVMERNAEHSKLEHCVPLIESVGKLESQLNVTQRFWRSPSEYTALSDKCNDAIKCVNAVDSTASEDVLHTFSACHFYIYYNRDFSNCADQLIAKKDEGSSCLNTLFNDVHEPNVNKCDQWDSIQKCIETEIKSICGDVTEIYEKNAAYFRTSVCSA